MRTRLKNTRGRLGGSQYALF